MKKFSLVEVVIIVFCAALLAALATAMAPARSAKQAYCADTMRQLLQISHQYVTDNNGIWGSALGGYGYLDSLRHGKYVNGGVMDLKTPSGRRLACPEAPVNRKARHPQGYGSVYNNGASYDPAWGVKIYSPEYDIAQRKGKQLKITPDARIWFSDSLNRLKNPYPSIFLTSSDSGILSSTKGVSFGVTATVHGGRANIATVAGWVNNAMPEDLPEYYFSRTFSFRGKAAHKSFPMAGYLHNRKLVLCK